LSYQVPPACSERGSNSDLTIARQGARQEQIDDVHGNYFQKFGNQTVPIAIDHSIGPSIPNETFCENADQNGAYTNLVNLSGNWSNGCFSEAGNGYPVGIQASGDNIGRIYNGGGVVGIFGATGNWKFLGTITVTSTNPSTIPNLSSYYFLPTPAQLAAGATCGSTTGVTDAGACIQDIYSFDVQSSTIVVVPTGHYSYATRFGGTTNGHRLLVEGVAAGGSVFSYTGIGCASVIDSGIQSGSIDHTTGNGFYGISFYGNNTATSSPQIGICSGTVNGTDGAVIDHTNVYGFGIGIQNATSTYHWIFENGTIGKNGQNVHINASGGPTGSGEEEVFMNVFVVDGANNNPNECFWADNSAVSSLTFISVSLDDCQLHLLQANNFTWTGGHDENPGYSAWGSYIPIKIDQNIATNANINGVTFFNDAPTSTSPSTFISNGGTLSLDGVITRSFSGFVVTRFVTEAGSGNTSWLGFNNVGSVSNVVGNVGVPVNGSDPSSTYTGTMTVYTLLDQNGNKYSTSTGTTYSSITQSASGTISIANQYYSVFASSTASTNAVTINWNNGNTQSLLLNTTTVVSFSNVNAGARYLLAVQQDGTGSRTVTWPSTVLWASGNPPTLTTTTNKLDIMSFVCLGVSSTNCYGSSNLNFSP
jgi:hypothetical protein